MFRQKAECVMHDMTIALTALMMLGLAAFMAPNILALNRGKVLRNIAIWLAIFAALGFVYKTFGPDGRKMIKAPAFVAEHKTAPAPATGKTGDKAGGGQNSTPPKE
jgi:hypothetical protein